MKTEAKNYQRNPGRLQRLVLPSSPKPYYQEDGITIYHGDNRTILPLLPDADLLLTDPPYGIGMARNKTIGLHGKETRRGTLKGGNLSTVRSSVWEKSEWDDQTAPAWMMELARSKCRQQIIWGGNYYALPPMRGWLVWDKDNTGDFADCELAWTNLDQAVRKLKWRWNGMLQENMAEKETRYHPTQKPLSLMSWSIGHTDAKTILDPWMGSGTTLVAAKERGLQAIGIEATEQYCQDAIARLAQGVLWRQNNALTKSHEI